MPFGNHRGPHSIRINDEWHVCFVRTDKGPTNVEIVDYHGSRNFSFPTAHASG